MIKRVIRGKENIISEKSMRLILMDNAELEAEFIAKDSEIKVEIFHREKNSKSNVVLKGLGKKKAKVVGKLVVEKGAKGSRGNLVIKGLSDGGEVEVIPAIEVYEKDADVEHSAFIQEIDEEMLFYLESRGIGRGAAKKIIVDGFLNHRL